MRTDEVARRSRRIGRHQLARAELVVEHQSHASRHTVASHGELFERSQVAHVDIERIEIVAPGVVLAEEWFASILCSRDTYPQAVGVAEGIAKAVGDGSAEIAVVITPTFVEGNASIEEKFMVSLFQDVAEGRPSSLGQRSDGDEVAKQPPCGKVDRWYHGQFAQRLHLVVLVKIGAYILYLSFVEEGESFKLFTCGGIDVDGLLFQFAERFIQFFPCATFGVVERGPLVEVVFPGVDVLCRQGYRQAEEQ